MSSRHKAREFALRALYSLDFHGNIGEEQESVNFPAVPDDEINSFSMEFTTYVNYLVSGTIEHIKQIDAIISKYSEKRTLENIERVDRNILRISIFMLLYQKSVHPTVIIDEALTLSQEYSSNISYKYINGMLDTIRKKEL